ncbi:hypothetical protein G5B40_06170 [Pikeienuella piscinae]|uniref:Mitochondrial inner membrane protein n=1 Tax=Pikeienuella piscinae TaxID=2748098 RepID=A0A7L5BXV6_9RHOB|nr:hypothetical protein [Pikeienuella piscinae]QIE55076.1 hypothetical protein G5B40_06170 [Pikeienuella piscinae]
MADQDEPKPARDRLEAARAAKAAASDAEIAPDEATPAPNNAAPVAEDAPPEPASDAAPEPLSDDGVDDGRREEATREPAPDIHPEAGVESETADAPAAAYAAAAQEDAEHRSFAAIALQWILIFFIGAAVALWAGPRIAPNLPAWAAPVAEFLTPGGDRSAEAVAALKAETEAELAALREQVATAEGAIAPLEAQIDELAATTESALKSTPEPADSAALTAIGDRVAALEAAIAGAGTDETPESVVALGAAVESLKEEIAALKERIGGIGSLAKADELAALAARVEALESGEAATAGARTEAEQIRRNANLDAALTRISEALISGAPFASAMNDAVSLSGEVAPEALAALAESGAPTARSLTQSFPAAARQGYAAALEAQAGDGFGDKLLAQLSGRIGGRPAVETPGPGVGAVLSRIEARLSEGRLSAAATEADALPPAAKTAMADWLDDLKRAAGAKRGFDDWRAALGAN